MAATPEPDEGGCSGVQVFLVERYHLGIQAAEKSEEHRTCIMAEPRRQHHGGFEHSGDSHHHHFGSVDSIDQPFVPGLTQVNGNNGGTIQNHASVALRPIAQDLVFFLPADYRSEEHTSELQ